MEPKIKTTNSLDPYFLRERMANRLNKRILINNTRASRATRMMNFKLAFIVAAFDDDDDPGMAAAPAPTPIVPPGGMYVPFAGTPESIELLALAVLA